jgi:hypothetical protein
MDTSLDPKPCRALGGCESRVKATHRMTGLGEPYVTEGISGS